MVKQEDLDKMQFRQNYHNVWHSDLLHTFQADTPYFCFSLFCAPCASYLLRKRALYNDMSRYVCCAGYMPCSGRCGESHCPEFCLATEVFCCFGDSVASTRFLIQDEFNIHTTQCDNCIIGFMFCLNQVACIFSIVAMIVGSEEITEASQLLSCLANYVYCTVCACMQTQHKVEMDKRDGKFRPQQPMAVPPFQLMSRIDQPYPPTVGYPAPTPGYTQPYQPAYAQPYPAQGYPVAGSYPPPAAEYPPNAPCASYLLRKRALYNDMSRYGCCAGYMPCSGRSGGSRCPEFCLATECVVIYKESIINTMG